MSKTILSLFDYTGNWSRPYKENGYNVIQIDLKLGQNIAKWNKLKLPDKVYGILAAPPCTDFASSGAKWFKEKDKDGRTQKSIELINHTLTVIACYAWDKDLKFWVIENPVGRLNKLVPFLKQHGPKYFQPYWYGDPYTKKTGLWGKFNMPKPTKIIKPKMYKDKNGKQGSWHWAKLGGKSERTKELRSATPMGFAYAFYEANK